MKFPRLFLAVLLGSLPVGAQQPPAPAPPAPGGGQVAPAPEQNQGAKVRGLAFQLDDPPEDVFAHDPATGGKVPGVKLDVKDYLNHEFSFLPLQAKDFIFTKSSDPASLKDTASVVAKVKVPANFKSGIFMFLPGSGKAGDPAFRVLVVEDSQRDFPAGSYRVINLSPQSVRIQMEDKNFDFASGESRLIEDPPVGPNKSTAMKAFATKAGKVERIASALLPKLGRKRSLQVLFFNPKSGLVEMRGIRDIVENY